jgi:hypothetical protein
MIDNPSKALELVERMKAALPIPARPAGQLVQLLAGKGVSLGANPRLEIKNVFYAGDEGGISCDITPDGSPDAVVCSVTHLRIHPRHPLAPEIQAYQETRSRKLARRGRGPTILTYDRK